MAAPAMTLEKAHAFIGMMDGTIAKQAMHLVKNVALRFMHSKTTTKVVTKHILRTFIVRGLPTKTINTAVVIDESSLPTNSPLTFTHPSMSSTTHASHFTLLCILATLAAVVAAATAISWSARAQRHFELETTRLATQAVKAREEVSEQRRIALFNEDQFHLEISGKEYKVQELEASVAKQAAKLDQVNSEALTTREVLETKIEEQKLQIAATAAKAASVAEEVAKRESVAKIRSHGKDIEILELNKRVEKAEHAFDLRSTEIGGLRKNATEVTRLKAELAASRQKNEEQCKDSEQKEAASQKELARLHDECTSLKADLLKQAELHDTAQQESTETIQALRKELKAESTTTQALKGELEHSESRARKDESDLASLAASTKSLESARVDLVSANQELQADSTRAVQAKANVEAEIANLKRGHDDLVHAHTCTLRRLDLVQDMSSYHRDRLESIIQTLRSEKQELDSEIVALKAKLRRLEAFAVNDDHGDLEEDDDDDEDDEDEDDVETLSPSPASPPSRPSASGNVDGGHDDDDDDDDVETQSPSSSSPPSRPSASDNDDKKDNNRESNGRKENEDEDEDSVETQSPPPSSPPPPAGVFDSDDVETQSPSSSAPLPYPGALGNIDGAHNDVETQSPSTSPPPPPPSKTVDEFEQHDGDSNDNSAHTQTLEPRSAGDLPPSGTDDNGTLASNAIEAPKRRERRGIPPKKHEQKAAAAERVEARAQQRQEEKQRKQQAELQKQQERQQAYQLQKAQQSGIMASRWAN